MSDGSTYAKPRLAGRGFAQSTWRLVAIFPYRVGLAGANARLSILPVAVDGAANGATLFWGELQ